MPKAKKARHAYYAVARGRNGSGVYKTWADTEDETRGVSNVRFRGCSSVADVRAFFSERGVDMGSVVWGPGTRITADTMTAPTSMASLPPPPLSSSNAVLLNNLFALLLRVSDQMDHTLTALGGRRACRALASRSVLSLPILVQPDRAA